MDWFGQGIMTVTPCHYFVGLIITTDNKEPYGHALGIWFKVNGSATITA